LWRQRIGGLGKGTDFTKVDRERKLARQEVAIGLSRETIKAAPEYTDESLLTRDYETGLYGHDNRQGYWVEEVATV
jgi:hypothetical protein